MIGPLQNSSSFLLNRSISEPYPEAYRHRAVSSCYALRTANDGAYGRIGFRPSSGNQFPHFPHYVTVV